MPISRLYTETYGEDADMSKIVPYHRNKIVPPRGMAECLGYLYNWKKQWHGDCFCYEYHFMHFQFWDVSNMFLSKILHKDIVSLKKHGIDGIIEDGSQRSFFPTGFQFYVYGETLFDSSVSYEALKEDYFSHAFGDNWKKVAEYLEKLSEYMEFAYYFGIKSTDAEKGRYYCPEMAEKAAKARKLAISFKSVVIENKNSAYRAQSVAWRLLERHIDIVLGVADITEYKCVGKHQEAIEAIDKLIDKMSAQEIFMERYYDHYLFARSFDGIIEGKRKFDNC